MAFIKKYFFLIAILIGGSMIRLWQLGNVPFGITHDEMGYLYNAYAISQTGKNVFGETLPFLTWMIQGGFPFLPVPIYFSAPFFWIFGLSGFTGRLPAALLGIGDIFLVYLIVKKLFHKESFALLAALFLAISPWHLHFSRTAYDPNFSLFFFLLGITFFLYTAKHKSFIFLAPLSFLFAIFSYRGMSVLALPLFLLLTWYGAFVAKMKRKQIYLFLAGIAVVLLCFGTVITIYGKSYTQEAAFWNDPKMQEAIDSQSREAQAPLVIERIFLNKPLYIINKLRENYVRSYSPEFLFLYTEPNHIYSIWSRGRIYFFDLILIITGIAYIYSISKKAGLFVTGLLLIGGLPGAVGGFPYSARNFFLSSVFPVFAAAGILFFYTNNFFKRIKPLVVIFFIGTYTFLLGSYLFDYYGRYAFYSGEAWVKSVKDLSIYINNHKKEYNKIIVGNTSFGDVVQYAFYTKLPVTTVQKAWETREKSSETISLGNITFQKTCVRPESNQTKKTLYIVHSHTCKISLPPTTIIRDYQGNSVWEIYTTP